MNLVLFLTIVAAVLLGLARVFVKLGSLNLHPLLSIVIMQATMLAVGFSIFLWKYQAIKENFIWNKNGLLFVVLAGLSLALFDICAFFIFRFGGKVSLFAPVTAGGGTIIAVLAGLIFLGEKITLLQAIGSILAVSGIIFILI